DWTPAAVGASPATESWLLISSRSTARYRRRYCLHSKIESTISRASPRTPFRIVADSTALGRTVNANSGCERAETVLAISSSTPFPRVRRRGRHRASSLYLVDITSTTRRGFEPTLAPISSGRTLFGFDDSAERIPSGRAYGWTRPRSSSTAYSSE